MYQFSPSLIKPPRWPIQPHLTAAPELWRGIGDGAVYAFYGDAHDLRNIFNGTNQGADLTSVGVAGVGATFTGSDRIELPDTVGQAIASSGTIAIVWSHDGTTNDGHFFDTRLGGDTGWDFEIANDAPPANSGTSITQSLSLQIDTFSDGAFGNIAAGLDISSINDKSVVAAVGRYDGANVMLDATGLGNDTQSQSGTASRSTTTKIGNQANNGDPLGSGRVLHLMVISSRSWTQIETDAFLRDPFAMLRPGPQLLPLLFGGAGATGSLVSLSGTIAATSTLTGRASVRRSVTGTAAATSGLEGRLSALRGVQGTATATTGTTGRLSALRNVQGTSATQTTLAGRMSVRRAVQGTIAAVTTLTGSLTKSAKVFLQGTIAATSSLTGRASVRRGVKGTVAAQTGTSGRVSVRRAVSGAVQAVATTAGRVSVHRAVRGTITVVTTLAGTLTKFAPTTRFSSTGRTRGKLRFDGRTKGR